MDVKDIEKAVITETVHTLVQAWLMAKAQAELLTEECEKIQREVLQDHPLYISDHWERHFTPGERITDPHDTHLADESTWGAYHKEVSDRERKAGIKPAEMSDDHGPDLVAKSDLVKVEWELLEQTCTPLGVDWESLYGENRQKWIDLVVGAWVNHPNFVHPLSGIGAPVK